MTTFVPIDKIQVPATRQRLDFDPVKLGELRDSITSTGLLHPPVVRSDSNGLWLVAGERRLRAIRDAADLGIMFTYAGQVVPAGTVPVTNLGDLTELERMEAEFEENVRRADLSWSESAAATTALLSLRSTQAQARGEAAPTVASISVEVRGRSDGAYHEKTRKEVLISKHLDNPDVAKAKTLDEAFKVVKKQEQQKKNKELAKSFGPSVTSNSHLLLNEDCLAWMKASPPSVFDVILTDPPYGMGADEFGDCGQSALGSHFYNDSFEHWVKLMAVFTVESFRLAKPDAHAYVFCDLDNFHALRQAMTSAGWRCFRTPLIWHKPSNFRAPWPDQGPQRKYETILYAVKGAKKTLRLGPDVITLPTDENLGHPAQKPVALFSDLLSRSCNPGEKVFDPFCGSGPVLEAAQALHLSATAIELDANAYGIAAARLSLLQLETQKELL
jgi:site-specific DNA-methyltransferase (adenine-specific)